MLERLGGQGRSCVAAVVLVGVVFASMAAFATLDLTVRDPSGDADDVAQVILFYPDTSQQDLGYTPQGIVSGRTWNLLTENFSFAFAGDYPMATSAWELEFTFRVFW